EFSTLTPRTRGSTGTNWQMSESSPTRWSTIRRSCPVWAMLTGVNIFQCWVMPVIGDRFVSRWKTEPTKGLSKIAKPHWYKADVICGSFARNPPSQTADLQMFSCQGGFERPTLLAHPVRNSRYSFCFFDFDSFFGLASDSTCSWFSTENTPLTLFA